MAGAEGMWGDPHPGELEPLGAVGGPKANVPHARSLTMSIALTVAAILKDHITVVSRVLCRFL